MVYRVFISSTAADLDPYRSAVHRALAQMERVEPVWMKSWVAQGAPSLDVCEGRVRDCQIFVGLIGQYFGSAPPERPDRSYTMLEFDWASQARTPRLMHRTPPGFTLDAALEEAMGEDRQALQEAFRESLDPWHLGQDDSWASPDRLATDVAEAVRQQIDRMEEAARAGFTRERHEVSLMDRFQELTMAIATGAGRAETLRAERAQVEALLRDLEGSYAEARTRIAELEARLSRDAGHLGPDRVARARAALEEGDFETADSVWAEVEEGADPAIQAAARAAFARGQIAEQQIRWRDAGEHYARAARLAPDFESLRLASLHLWLAGEVDRSYGLDLELATLTEREYGTESLENAIALNHLGESHRALDRTDRAEDDFRRALEIVEATAHAGTREHAVMLNNLASLLVALDRRGEAEPLYLRAIDIDRAVAGDNKADLATRLTNYAELLKRERRLDEARALVAEAAGIREAALGPDHPNTLNSVWHQASLAWAEADAEGARPLYARACAGLRAGLGDGHPTSQRPLRNEWIPLCYGIG